MFAEAVQIDGGVIMLILLALLAAFLTFVGLCWAAYRAGAGHRGSQLIVGAGVLLAVVLAVFDLTVLLQLIIPIGFLGVCAAVGYIRSRR